MSGSKETTQTNEPNDMQKPYYSTLYSAADKAFQNSQNLGNQYVGPNATQKTANQQVVDLAPSLSQGSTQLRDLALSQIAGDWLSPDTNPYIAQVANAALEPVQQQFTANKLGIEDRAIAQGAYGGTRQDLQQLRALEDYTKQAGNITSGIYANNYANERGIQQNSGGLLDAANALALAGPTALAGAGAQQQGWDQGALSGEAASNWAGIQELANVLASGGFGKSTVEEPTSPLGGALQGALGGAGLGASAATSIGGLTAASGLGAFAPWLAIPGILGGLAGGLG